MLLQPTHTKQVLNVLELFAGTAVFTRKARERGHRAFSNDIEHWDHIDVVGDFREAPGRIRNVEGVWDVVWASPPCQAFSVASIGKHWTGGVRGYEPKTEAAKGSIVRVEDLLELIGTMLDKNPDLLFYIENPVGMLRKMAIMQPGELSRRFGETVTRQRITLCQYGDRRMKPTDIWTNDPYWAPREPCKNGDPCHASAPRGSRTEGSTQGLKGAYDRGRLPEELCEEVLQSAESWGTVQLPPNL